MATERDWIRIDLRHQEEQAQQMKDHELALHLLAGFAEEGKGRSTRSITKYPKKGGPDARAGMRAIARIIRREMKGFVGEFLALGFDPETQSKYPAPTKSGRLQPTVRISVAPVGRRQKPTVLRDILIAAYIRRALSDSARLVGASVRVKRESAIEAATKKFKISRTRAQQIWKNHEIMMARGLDREPSATK